MSTPSDSESLTTLGLNLTRSCRYLHESQGVSKLDLIWVLHGILGQVLSWEGMIQKDRFGKDGLEDEYPSDGRGFDPGDLH